MTSNWILNCSKYYIYKIGGIKMKKVTYSCDICGKEVNSEEEYQEQFKSLNSKTSIDVPNRVILHQICNVSINDKKLNIETLISSEQIEHLCNECFKE